MSRPTPRHRVPLLFLLLLALALTACAQAAPVTTPADNGPVSDPGASPSVQVNDEGAVQIEITWVDPDEPVFLVTMETHSVDLDGYDLAALATLRTRGGTEVAPSSWDAPPGGHHRSGTLTFPATDAAGNPVLGNGQSPLEIVIRDVAKVPERRFQWAP